MKPRLAIQRFSTTARLWTSCCTKSPNAGHLRWRGGRLARRPAHSREANHRFPQLVIGHVLRPIRLGEIEHGECRTLGRRKAHVVTACAIVRQNLSHGDLLLRRALGVDDARWRADAPITMAAG